jgi:hypothetical protein
MWKNLQDLEYNPVKLRSEFLAYHSSCEIPKKPDIDTNTLSDEYALIKEALTVGDGIIFGEEHFDNVSAGFLVDNMEYLESLGVDTLFFEGLFYDLERGADGKGDERDNVHQEYSRLIDSAKKHNLKIVGIDSKGCKRGDGITRDIFMNAHGAAVINGTEKKKWIALTGMMHLESSLFIDSVTMRKYKVHGLADLTGATSIILHAIDSSQRKYIKPKSQFLAWPAKRISPDFLVGIYSYKHTAEAYRGKIIMNPVEELYQNIKHQGWNILHYDIDTYAKYHLKAGYLRGAIFSFVNTGVGADFLASLKQNLETTCNGFTNDNASWFHVAIDQNELIFSCNFESIEYAAESAKESLLNRELFEELNPV